MSPLRLVVPSLIDLGIAFDLAAAKEATGWAAVERDHNASALADVASTASARAHEIAEQIIAAPAVTIPELAVKARVLGWYFETGCTIDPDTASIGDRLALQLATTLKSGAVK